MSIICSVKLQAVAEDGLSAFATICDREKTQHCIRWLGLWGAGDNVRPPSVAMTRASSGEPNQKIPIVSPAAKAAPSSLHRLRSSGATDFGAKIASDVCACVQTMIGSAMGRSRQPVAMRSI